MRAIVVLIVAMSVAPIHAFSQSINLSGLVFADYSYTVSSPNSDEEGENGFGYRRVYLTADSRISDKFSARVRLEANDASTTTQGNPAPFVKDLFVKWKDVFAEGHSLEFGITSPPSFTVAEKVWGYRSLEKTILDRTKVVSSRDMGVVARGPVTADGRVKYGLMLANNSGVKAETDKNKRVYGQLEFYPNDVVVATVGSDFATYPDERDQTLNGNAFVGIHKSGVTAGVEAFASTTSFKDGSADESKFGVAVFARGAMSERIEVVGRFDRVTNGVAESFFVAGLAVMPAAQVRIIPNILVTKLDNADSFTAARLTLHADF